MKENYTFKTESKQLLDLMIHSIYTHKEIFLRELISNASDAMDKLYFESLQNSEVNADDMSIFIEVDEDSRTIKITDKGIGMTSEELIDHLGTIAKSGSKAFAEKIKEAEHDLDIIGQFGVGFYSAFMVADRIVVESRSFKSDTGYRFESTGEEGFTIEEISKEDIGTSITLHVREDESEDAEDGFSQYLTEYEIKSLVKKYSDYVRYPINMNVSKSVPKKDENGEVVEGEYDTVTELETLNSMKPIWKKRKNEVTEEEYKEFYQSKFHQWQDPFKVIHTHAEGTINYSALLYIPSEPQQDLYSQEFEKGLQLYSKGIFIMDKNKELIPDYLRFVQGLIDTDAISLNISREILQQNKQVKLIAKNIEKKILSELKKSLKKDREEYIKFFEAFGVNLKYGVYDNFGAKKEELKDLLLFKSSEDDEYITLSEYVAKMDADQEFVYYVTGKKNIEKLPQLELLKKKGYAVLLLTDEVDEFALEMLGEYDGKSFKSITKGDLGIEDKEAEEKVKEQTESNKDLLSYLGESLEDVKEVRLSTRLESSAVCLVSDNEVSLEMERVMSKMPNANPFMPKAERVLEINPNHPLFTALTKVFNSDKDDAKKYAKVLYDQALLVEGFELDDPIEYSNLITELLLKSM